MILAGIYRGTDPAGWWISEKYDGVRAFWDGKVLRTRDAWMAIAAPAWFTATLPAGRVLDGELWCGRGAAREGFRATLSIALAKRIDNAAWRSARYMVFDAPADGPRFEDRLQVLAELELARHVVKVQHVRCESLLELGAIYSGIREIHGEGVMLRQAGHQYEFGRSRALLKLKPGEGERALIASLDLAAKRAA